MRESLMIRPFVELENSFLCTWHPSEGGEEERSWLPAFTSIIVEFSWMGKIIPLFQDRKTNRESRSASSFRSCEFYYKFYYKFEGWRCYR